MTIAISWAEVWQKRRGEEGFMRWLERARVGEGRAAVPCFDVTESDGRDYPLGRQPERSGQFAGGCGIATGAGRWAPEREQSHCSVRHRAALPVSSVRLSVLSPCPPSSPCSPFSLGPCASCSAARARLCVLPSRHGAAPWRRVVQRPPTTPNRNRRRSIIGGRHPTHAQILSRRRRT